MQALFRYPKEIRSEKAREFSARGADIRAQRRLENGVDAETIRRRALDDARGTILRHGCTYTAGAETAWQVVRSIAGRMTQFDLVANGTTIRTAGRRRLPRRFRP